MNSVKLKVIFFVDGVVAVVAVVGDENPAILHVIF